MADDDKKVILNLENLKLSKNALDSKCEEDDFFDNLMLSDTSLGDGEASQEEENMFAAFEAGIAPPEDDFKDTPKVALNFDAASIQKTEKRNHKRAEVSSKIVVKDENGRLLSKAQCLNISSGGLAICLNLDGLVADQTLLLELIGDENLPPLVLKCAVRRTEDSPNYNVAGLEIIEMSERTAKKITEFIADLTNAGT